MKKIILHIIISAIVLSSFPMFGIEKVHAQNLTPGQESIIKEQNDLLNKKAELMNKPVNERPADYNQQLDDLRKQIDDNQAKVHEENKAAGKKQDEINKISKASGGCMTVWNGFNPSACLQFVFQWIGNAILSIMSIVLWFAGMSLNWVMNVTLTNMADSLNEVTGISKAWTTIRDLANMLFIFVLLYISISTILGLAGGATKKLLANVIIAAVLINFSLLFTKMIVDASNIVAITVYKSIPGVGTVFGEKGVTGMSGAGVSGSIMQHLKLQSIYDLSAKDGANNGVLSNAGGALTGVVGSVFAFLFATLGGSAFILITAVVFLVTAFMFVIRFVIIIFLLILSPLAFVGMILPQLSSYSKRWWEALWGQAIFAPALMIMIWVTLQVSTGISKVSGANNGSFGEVFSASVSASFGIILNFAIIITMMIFSLIIAKKVGEMGGHGLMAYADKFQGLIGRSAVRYSGLRKLDEKFGETTFGNTGFGSSLRQYTTGALANNKFGGTMSAEEAHDEATQLESEREDIKNRNKFQQLVNSGASILDIQRQLALIEPKNFAKLPREVLLDPKYMKYASLAQMQAVKDEKEGRLSLEEKRESLIANAGNHFKNLEAYDEAYDEWEKEFDKDPTKAGDPPSMSDMFPDTRKWLREMPAQGPELYYWANPNILKRKGASAFKFGSVEAIRKSQQIGEADKDVMRGTKAIDFLTAEDAYMGIKLSIPDEAKEKLRDQFNNIFKDGKKIKEIDKNGKEIEKEIYKKGTDLAAVGGEVEIELSRFTKETLEELRKNHPELISGDKLKYKYTAKTRVASYDLMDQAYKGKNPTEILKMRGKHWQTPAIYKILGRDQMRDMNVNKDNGEKEPYLDWAVEELRKEKEGEMDPATGKPYQMTEQTRSVLKWIHDSKDRFAEEYLPGHKWKIEGHAWSGGDIRKILKEEVDAKIFEPKEERPAHTTSTVSPSSGFTAGGAIPHP